MGTSILLLLAGLFAIICTLKKPAFYWESRKARRLRRFIGDTAATFFYMGMGIILVGISIFNLLGIITI
ncbi:hypothetical protein [Marinisporobacter balticus]|uniref:Immunity protein 17 of polymorphic toxin system n=1 Tax=Marinisporobacter balticus TaxID=2018667 RepID=A0A4R2L1P8_9FIRM|nr:hypothetical protein [Marinisporobacter balticus]TCO79117.1 hypothetical protein EV214_103169 [Marinisporobacter balticus]